MLERGQPRRQANLAADWERAGFGALLRVNHYGPTTQHPIDTGMIRIEPATIVDVEARLEFGATRWALGVSNVFDKLPNRLSKNPSLERALGHQVSDRHAVRTGGAVRLSAAGRRIRLVARVANCTARGRRIRP